MIKTSLKTYVDCQAGETRCYCPECFPLLTPATWSMLPDDLIEKEKDIFSSQIDPKKPDNIKEKIINGKVAKMLNTICLLKQPYVKNPDITIEEHLTNESSSLGAPIEISQFHRMQLGD
ncbi:hypothetical protein IIB34_05535 [PVC group bacterium]|nr:hypothetical protein [PVC group bacterium]